MKPVKNTLDKDLDKYSLIEAAGLQVSRGFVAVGAGGLFLAFVMVFAASFAMHEASLVIIVAAAMVGAYMAMNIGANDVTNNVGPAVGARALTMTSALVIAAICETAGALIAGGDVVATVSEGIVTPALFADSARLTWVMMAALLGAALWVNIATVLGAPISTTHAIVGGVLGSALIAGGLSAISWTAMLGIVASWLISPLLGALIAIGFLAFIKEFIIYRPDKIAAARRWVPVLIGVMTGAFATYIAIKGVQQLVQVSLTGASIGGLMAGIAAWGFSVPLIRRQSQGLENRNQSLKTLFRLPLIGSAALLSFAHGANDVANAIGPLSAIIHAVHAEGVGQEVVVPRWVLVIGALGLSVGLLAFGPRLIRLVGGEITKLNPMRAYCVSLSAALTVIIASWFGLPVSSTHIAVGAVFGVGFFREWYLRHSKRRAAYMRMKAEDWDMDEPADPNDAELRRRYLVRRSHFMTIAAAWSITVPVAASLAALLYLAMTLLFV